MLRRKQQSEALKKERELLKKLDSKNPKVRYKAAGFFGT